MIAEDWSLLFALLAQVIVEAALTASSASVEQCSFSGGIPPRAWITSRLVNARASSTVTAFEEFGGCAGSSDGSATAKGLKPGVHDSVVLYFEAKRITSPNAAAPTSPTPSASSSGPTFLGLRKCSRIAFEYELGSLKRHSNPLRVIVGAERVQPSRTAPARALAPVDKFRLCSGITVRTTRANGHRFNHAERKYIHAAFGLRYLLANLGELQPRAGIVEFDINQKPLDIVEIAARPQPQNHRVWSLHLECGTNA